MAGTKSTGLQSFTNEFAHSICLDYEEAIALGYFPAKERFRGFGRRTALATTAAGDDIWEGAAVYIPLPDQTAGEQMTIVSTNAGDTAAGAGARTVEIHYLTAAGVAASETVTLNGTTPVNTAATNIRFVQRMHCLTVGSFGATCLGTITLYKLATPATVYCQISIGSNISLSTLRMVPVNKSFFMTNLLATATDNKPVSVRIRATADTDGTLTPGVFLHEECFELQNSAVGMGINIPRKFPALCVIKATAYSTTVGGSASVSYDGWIE